MRGGRSASLADDSDVWQPPSRREVQGRNVAARAGAAGMQAWRDATSSVMEAVRRPATLRERLRSDRKTQVIAAIMLVVMLCCMIPTPILAYSNTMGLAKDGIAHLKNAENDFKTLATSPTNLTTINDAQQELQRAHDDFAQLQLRVGLLAPLGLAPKVGAKIAGANKLAPLAVDGTQAGILACDAMKILVTGMKNPLGTTGGLSSADTDQIASDVDQRTRLLVVHGSIRSQHANDDTVRTQAARRHDVPPHDVELGLGIHEPTTTRSNDHEQRNRHMLAAGRDHPRTGRGPAVEQRITQLEAAGATALGRLRGLDRVHARFDDHR